MRHHAAVGVYQARRRSDRCAAGADFKSRRGSVRGSESRVQGAYFAVASASRVFPRQRHDAGNHCAFVIVVVFAAGATATVAGTAALPHTQILAPRTGVAT